jgi:hypothetical protein
MSESFEEGYLPKRRKLSFPEKIIQNATANSEKIVSNEKDVPIGDKVAIFKSVCLFKKEVN